MWKKWQLVPFFFFFPWRGIISIGIALLLWHATHKTRKWSWLHGFKSKFSKNLLKIYYLGIYLVFIKAIKRRTVILISVLTKYSIIYFPKYYGEYHQKFLEIIPLVYFWLVFHMNITKFLLWVIHPSMCKAAYNTIEQKSFNGKPLLNKAAYI